MNRRMIHQVIFGNLLTKLATFRMNIKNICISNKLYNANLLNGWC
jgi:hypothetical protein